MKVEPKETLHLKDTKDFKERILKVYQCPVCLHPLAKLVCRRIEDNQKFECLYTREDATEVITSLKGDVVRSQTDFNNKGYSRIYGFRYGVNTEKINKKTGEVTILQEACDFNGNKEMIRLSRTKF
jgi:ribosomal protein L37AE/L43A